MASTQSSQTFRVRTTTLYNILFVDFTYALIAVSPMKPMGLSNSLCIHIFDVLTNRAQIVLIGGHTSSTVAPEH